MCLREDKQHTHTSELHLKKKLFVLLLHRVAFWLKAQYILCIINLIRMASRAIFSITDLKCFGSSDAYVELNTFIRACCSAITGFKNSDPLDLSEVSGIETRFHPII